MSEPLLTIRNLQKTYENGVTALKGVSFDVHPHEFLVVIGLSGSGKSTLLRCLNRLIEPTAGEIHFAGQRIDKAHGKGVREVRRKIAMIFQSFNLISRHSVTRNVLMGRLGSTSTLRSIFGHYSADDLAQAHRYLNLVGIGEKAKSRADHLSGGQQQRVAIARALCQNPQILLADEPVASLDPATCAIVMNYLRKVNQELGITVICNLHSLDLVREYATRVIALRAGQVVFEGQPQDINEQWFKKIYGESASDINVR